MRYSEFIGLLKDNRKWRSFGPWILLGLLVHVAGFLLLRVEIAPPPGIERHAPFVTWISGGLDESDDLFREQSLLMDTAVLFVPRITTRVDVDWNSPERGYALRFQPVEPNIRMDTLDSVQQMGLSDRYAITQPIDLLQTRFWRLFDRIGFADLMLAEADSAAPRGYQLHHWQSSDQPIEMSDGELSTFPERRGRLLGAPADMIMHVDERGMIGRAVRLSDPNNREFIDAVHSWLQTPALTYPLEPGSYSIRVFP